MWAFITSKITFSGVLWGSLGLVLLWFLYSYSALSNDLSDAKWNVATLTNERDAAKYTIEQMQKSETQRKEWNAEFDKQSKAFKKALDGYTLTLEGIKNERLKAGTNNSLSEPVARVLKDFNGKDKL